MALIGSLSGPGAGRAARSWPAGWLAAWRRFAESRDRRHWQRQARREEAYLAQAASMEDLERRMRELDSEARRPRFIGCF